MKRKLSNFNQTKVQLSDKNMKVIIGGGYTERKGPGDEDEPDSSDGIGKAAITIIA